MNDCPYYTSLLTKDIRHVQRRCYFEYRPDKGWRWVQKLILGILKKIGAYRVDEVQTFKSVDIHATKLHRFLNEFNQEVYRRTGEPAKRVIMGWRTFKYFVESDEIRDMLCVTQHLDLPRPRPIGNYERAYYMGYHIITFPWFEEGVIMLPNNLWAAD
jgi:hypothetical protein